MNEKVGSTIQTIATVSVIIGIIASIIMGIVLMVADSFYNCPCFVQPTPPH